MADTAWPRDETDFRATLSLGGPTGSSAHFAWRGVASPSAGAALTTIPPPRRRFRASGHVLI
eukprot:1163879-Pleurochrysis_carterae.AAC.2